MRTNYSVKLNQFYIYGTINCYLEKPDVSYSVWPHSEHNVHIFFCLSENRRHDKNLIISSHKEPKSSGLSCFYSLSHVLKIWERWKRFYNLGLYFSKIIIFGRSSFYVICLTSSYHQSLFIDIINFIIEFIIWNQKRKLILFKGKQFVLKWEWKQRTEDVWFRWENWEEKLECRDCEGRVRLRINLSWHDHDRLTKYFLQTAGSSSSVMSECVSKLCIDSPGST